MHAPGRWGFARALGRGVEALGKEPCGILCHSAREVGNYFHFNPTGGWPGAQRANSHLSEIVRVYRAACSVGVVHGPDKCLALGIHVTTALTSMSGLQSIKNALRVWRLRVVLEAPNPKLASFIQKTNCKYKSASNVSKSREVLQSLVFLFFLGEGCRGLA